MDHFKRVFGTKRLEGIHLAIGKGRAEESAPYWLPIFILLFSKIQTSIETASFLKRELNTTF